MQVYNLWGVLAGAVILSVALLATYKSFSYYNKLRTPLARKLAFMTLLSSTFAVAGSVGTVADSISEDPLWWIMAAFFTVSYIIIISAVFLYLELLHRATVGSVENPLSKKGHNPISSEEENGPKTLLPPGGFTVSPSDIPKLTSLCKLAKAVLYVGRNYEANVCPKLDGKIWITRIKAPGSVDPSKLHVIQERIIHFVSDQGAGTLVVFEGIEHLSLYNDFRSVMKFLTALKDYMLLTSSTLIVIIGEGELRETELSVLRRELLPMDVEKRLFQAEEIALFGALSKEDLGEGLLDRISEMRVHGNGN